MNKAGPESSLRTTRDTVRSLQSLARRTVRRWPVLVAFLALAAAAAVLAPRVFKPEYRSETVMLYREIIQAGTVLDPGYQADSRRQMGPRLREMMLSRTNLENVIGELNLYPDVVRSRGMLDAVDEMRLHLDFRIRDGDTFGIAFTGEDPAVVYAVTRKLADALIEQANRYRIEEAESTKAFLVTEQKRTADQLRTKEEALARFLTRHPEFAQDTAAMGGQTAGASVRAAERRSTAGAAMDPTTQALGRQALRLRQQLRSPGSAPGPAPVAAPAELDPESAAAIRRAEEDLSSATRRLAELQSRFTPQHPDVQAAQARVRDAQGSVDRARASARTVAPPPLAAAEPAPSPAASPEELQTQLNRVEAALSSKKRGNAPAAPAARDDGSWIVALETEWAGLNRDVADVRERNQQIQTRLFRASIIASVESNDSASKMVVVDPAYEPTRPTSKGKRRTSAMAAFAVMLMGFGVAVVAALFDDRIYGELELRRLGIGKLAHVIPRGSERRRRKSHG